MNSNPETSIIIRTKNEAGSIAKTLEKLFAQTYTNFEILVIDSGSTDQTLEIAKEYPVRILHIPPEDFSYPYALNYAIEKSLGAKYIVSIPAHALPISKTWLADGITSFQKYAKVCGVYGFIKPLPDGSLWDKIIIHTYNSGLFLRLRYKTHIQRSWTKGILGNTNAIILKSLWKKRRYKEEYGAGGEDEEWADYWTKQGYIVIKDTKFTVYHSHKLSFVGWTAQLNEWYKASKDERKFQVLTYRTNG